MGKLSKFFVIFGVLTVTVSFILQPLSSPFIVTAAVEKNSTSGQDWPTVQLSSNLNVSWEAIKTIPDNNGLLYVLWNEFNQTSNETYLYFCFYDGITFSTPELILYLQQNVTIDMLRIPFDAVFDSLNRLHIVYLLKVEDYHFYHQYYSAGIWSTPVLLDYWGQFTLLSDSLGNVYLFGVMRYPENAPNIFERVFSGNNWSLVMQLTTYFDFPSTTQYISDLTPSVDKEADRIFIGYNYGTSMFIEDEGFIESWKFQYLIKDGRNWYLKEYKAGYCFEPKSVIDDKGKVHLIYNSNFNIEGYSFNYSILKNIWEPEENILIYTDNDPEARFEPHIYDMKILGSDIFVTYSNFEAIGEVIDSDINLLHYNASHGWTQIPVHQDYYALFDYTLSFLPKVSLNENGTVVVIHLAITRFILLASYKNEFFVYSPMQGLLGYNMIITLFAIIIILPLTAKRRKNN
ncbi:MAG TPA: hypothetical protein VMX17_01775 [Candidatus Glassbacteria bacterium]|nr:hypothetical protein [Candidatus Glassbacteria bacterium]